MLFLTGACSRVSNLECLDFIKGKDVAADVYCTCVDDDYPPWGDQVVCVDAERYVFWFAAVGFDLKRTNSPFVCGSSIQISSLCISDRWHDVPANKGKFLGNMVEADVASNLFVVTHLVSLT